MATAYAIITIAGTARMFVVKSWVANFSELLNVVVSLVRDDIIEYKVNITVDAIHDPAISFRCCLMEEKDGLISPKASFVVAVEPTIEPTPPMVVINAG